MKKIIGILLLVLPFSMAYAGPKEKDITPQVKQTELLASKYKYHFIKTWTHVPTKELEVILTNNQYKIPTDSIVTYESTILDKENADNLKLAGNTIFQRRIAYNKTDLETQYNAKESGTNYSYGEIINKTCLSLGVNLITNNYLTHQKPHTKNVVFVDSLLHIEDRYIESNNICSTDSIVKMKIKYTLKSDPTNIEFQWFGIDERNDSIPEGKVINVNNKEILLLISPNVYRKDKTGQLSYLHYLFYISLIE